MPTLPRVDFVGRLVLVRDAAGTKPEPGHVPAEVTAEGYLDAWALTARDGLLTYSDGARSWQEYRPREELEASLDGWAFVPLADGHPPTMITSATWAQYARGHGMGAPEIVEIDGVAYTRQRVRFADAALVAKVQSGEQLELSIGLLSDVIPADDYGGDARGAEAVQTAIVPNHHASVTRGRAGPMVRVLLDGAAAPVCWPGLEQGLVPAPPPAPLRTDYMENDKPKPDAVKDEIGNPTETVEIPGPDGKAHPIPSFAAAELEMLRQRVAQLEAQLGGAPAPAAPPAMAGQTNAAAPSNAPPMRMPNEMPMDAATALRQRAKLERHAGKLGIADAAIDSATDAQLAEAVDARAREAVTRGLPYAAEQAKSLRGDALMALATAAMAAPTVAQPSANPWATPANPAPIPAPRKDAASELLEALRDRFE